VCVCVCVNIVMPDRTLSKIVVRCLSTIAHDWLKTFGAVVRGLSAFLSCSIVQCTVAQQIVLISEQINDDDNDDDDDDFIVV